MEPLHPGKRYSIVWKYFIDQPKDEEGVAVVKCKLCGHILKYHGQTKCLYKHLKMSHGRQHGMIMSTVRDKKKIARRRSGAWNYFVDEESDDLHKKLARCKLCNTIVPYKGHVMNLQSHLRAVHKMHSGNKSQGSNLLNNYVICNSPRNTAPPETAIQIEPKTILFEPKSEPEVIFDDDQDANRLSLDLMTPNESREHSPLLVPLETTSECTGANVNTYSVEESQLPESSTFIDSSQSANTYLNAAGNLDKHGHNLDLNATLTDISAEVKYIKSHFFGDSDTFFYKSVAEELDNMPEDSKDFVKAAVWQIIYKVKSAKRKNVELSVSDLIK